MACKMFDLNEVSSSWTSKHLRTEMWSAKAVLRSNLMSALKVMKTKHHAFIFMRLAMNGTILQYKYKTIRGPLSEKIARIYFRGLMNGVKYFHQNNIVHRDLKLDNFLLVDQQLTPMITDFGFAVKGETTVLSRHSNTLRRTISDSEPPIQCETLWLKPEYVAPKVHFLPIGKLFDDKTMANWACPSLKWSTLSNR